MPRERESPKEDPKPTTRRDHRHYPDDVGDGRVWRQRVH